MQIVVVDECDPAAEARVDRAAIDLLQMVLAGVVGRVRLAGEDELQRPPRRVQDAEEPLGIVEDQLGAFVACEATRETDRQRIGIEQCAGRHDPGGAHVFFLPP